jgi:DNA-binding GntR family transcriptional regulator
VRGIDVEGLSPLDRPSTSEVVTSQIRDRILDGTFPPGAQLREVMLARQLEISRGPLREALHRLIQEGLLEQRRHRGVFVVRLDESDVADIYFVRETIEIPAAIHLARNPSAEAIAALHELVELMTGAANRHDWALVVQLDAEFHQVIVRSVGSERLARMFDTLQAETRMCVGALRPAYPIEYEVVVEHQELLHALLGGDEEAIRRLWVKHLRDAAANLGAHLDGATPNLPA